MDCIVLENEALVCKFNRNNGALVGLTAKSTNWAILDRPQLGLSYKLLTPLPDRRNNPVLGEQQEVELVSISPDQDSVMFTYDGVTSEHGGWHDIRVVLQVKLSDTQATFKMEIDNQSDLIVENVYSPYLGDVQRPHDAEWLKSFSRNLHGAQEHSIWPTFQNTRGYFGTEFPTQLDPAGIDGVEMWGPIPPFILIRSKQEGIYFGLSSPSDELVTWHLELRPGYISMMNSRVPTSSLIGDKEVSTRFAAVHVPYVMPGQTRQLTPILVAPFQGGWQKGADIYKSWRNTWMKTPPLPSWTKDPHSWQEVQLNSPEDELRMAFSELIEIGKDCERHGVKAIQLVGWNEGGQDGNIPFHDPDPRLGTHEDFKDAIQKIQSLGVKVVLFSKFTWADRLNKRFKDELLPMAIRDPYNDTYIFEGYHYHTATQLLDINTRRLVPMCFLSEDYLKLCEQEFQKIVDLGVDGILFDCCLEHTPALLCFNVDHGHRYGAYVFANDREIIRRFTKHVPEPKTEFLFSGEACYDWEYEVYHMGYIRSYRKDHVPLARYLLPKVPIMTAVTGFNDRHMINQCLLYRYSISYEPFHFKGRLDDFPLTVKYGSQMDELRMQLQDYFWDGEFRHEVGATVSVDGIPHHPYSVFYNQKNDALGVAIANYDEENKIVAEVIIDNDQPLNRFRLVDDPIWQATSKEVTIPPSSAAVVI